MGRFQCTEHQGQLACIGESAGDDRSCTEEDEAARYHFAQQQAQQGVISGPHPDAVGWVTA